MERCGDSIGATVRARGRAFMRYADTRGTPRSALRLYALLIVAVAFAGPGGGDRRHFLNIFRSLPGTRLSFPLSSAHWKFAFSDGATSTLSPAAYLVREAQSVKPDTTL